MNTNHFNLHVYKHLNKKLLKIQSFMHLECEKLRQTVRDFKEEIT